MFATMRFLAIISLFLARISLAEAQGENPQQAVERILADWKARQDRIQSIQVEVSGTNFYPKGRWDEDSAEDQTGKELLAKLGHIPQQDTRNPVRSQFSLQLDSNWARKELEWMIMYRAVGQFAFEHTTHLYNGEQIKVYKPREKNTTDAHTPAKAQPDLWMQTASYSNKFFAIEDSPVFWGCGIVPLNGAEPKQLKIPIDPRNYQFKGFGDLQGRRCVVLRSPNLMQNAEKWSEFWIDPKSESAIVRSQLYIQGKLSYQIDADWQLFEGGWFPKAWKYSYYFNSDKGSRLSTSFDLSVGRVVFNPQLVASDFDVKLKPKMVVYDVGQNSHGIVGSDGSTVLPISTLEAPSRWRILRIAMLRVGAVVVILSAGWYLRRRWVLRASHE
jgi:hypothetical protein